MTDTIAKQLSESGQAILNARRNHANLSLAEMYSPLTMPKDLREAHRKNDKVVLKAYGLKPSASEAEIVQHLFKMYEQLTKK